MFSHGYRQKAQFQKKLSNLSKKFHIMRPYETNHGQLRKTFRGWKGTETEAAESLLGETDFFFSPLNITIGDPLSMKHLSILEKALN